VDAPHVRLPGVAYPIIIGLALRATIAEPHGPLGHEGCSCRPGYGVSADERTTNTGRAACPLQKAWCRTRPLRIALKAAWEKCWTDVHGSACMELLASPL
jgi:hypothetical protein